MAVDVRRRATELFESLADRLGISVWSVIVGSVAVATAGLGGWWAFATPDPPPVEQVLPRVDTTEATAGPAPSTTGAPDAAQPTTIVVHIDGAVARPGVHELREGSRVVHAVDAAGGLLAEADRARLNLAAPIADGQRLWVPLQGEDEPSVVALEGEGPPVDDSAATDRLIDLNTADQTTLETLPGVGPAIATAIMEHREREGRFERVEDLLAVAGIGPTRFARIQPLVTV